MEILWAGRTSVLQTVNKRTMETIKKCKISRYDETITKPPYLTIQIDELEIAQPSIDHLGEEFYRRLVIACKIRKYRLKFYTTCNDDKYDYNVVVH